MPDQIVTPTKNPQSAVEGVCNGAFSESPIDTKDLPLIREASRLLGLDVAEFIRLSPYMYARDYLWSLRIDPRTFVELKND